jgi:hypothetical protein
MRFPQHSTDAIAHSFALRDPAVLLVRHRPWLSCPPATDLRLLCFACEFCVCVACVALPCLTVCAHVCGVWCVCVYVCVCWYGQRLLGRAMESDRKLRKRVLEVISKITVTDFEAQLPALLQVLPEPNVREQQSICICDTRASQPASQPATHALPDWQAH